MISWAFVCIMEDVTLHVIGFFFCFFLKGHLTYGSDRIYANQSLSGAQTIVSAGGNFKLGFFNPGNSEAANFRTDNYYLGIWYNNIIVGSEAVVWVANRLKPISNKTSTLKILNGNLVILNGYNESIWSTNITKRGSKNLVVVLRGDGNLVLTNVSNLDMEPPFWQSFDHPGNTWLPGAKISFNKLSNTKQILTSWKNDEDPAPGSYSLELDIDSSQLIMRWNRSQQYWTSGSWNDGFSLGETKLDYHFIFVDNGNESYFTYLMNDFSTMSRFVMLPRGQLNQYVQEALISSEPSEQCQVYAFCGAFGFCDKSLPFSCGCLPGFGLESYNAKPLQDFSGGCSRQIPLQCGKRDDFRMITSTYLRDQSIILTDVSHAGCEASCLSNCTCTAYSYDNGGCSMWNSGIYNLGQYKAGEPERTIYIRLAPSQFSTQTSKRKTSITPIIIGVVMLVFLVILLVVVWRWGKLRKAWIREFFYSAFNKELPTSEASKPEWSDIQNFTFNIIQAATESFSPANKLGEGGFGQVFKGKLANGQEIAVKRLSRTSGQGVEEFKNEVTLISKVQHRNLVTLLGFCIKGEERLLVYEFMPNKGLDSFIFGPASSENRALDWGSRINIIEGIARGLLYLHRDSRLKIIHRDLKASNILLDGHMIPRISDFGMARMVRIDQSAANTNRVVGTYGYMSPEYALQGMFSVKSDVFSFGVLLLEIVSGKRNNCFYDCENPQTLLGYAWQLWEEGKAFELLNPSMAGSCNSTQVYKCIHVALLCVQEHVNDRPTMSEVVFMLCNDTNLATPKKPAFCWASRPDGSTPILNHEAVDDSRNEISVSSVYGR